MDIQRVIDFILDELDWAHFGNKNLNKKQYFILEDIKDTLKELKKDLKRKGE